MIQYTKENREQILRAARRKDTHEEAIRVLRRGAYFLASVEYGHDVPESLNPRIKDKELSVFDELVTEYLDRITRDIRSHQKQLGQEKV